MRCLAQRHFPHPEGADRTVGREAQVCSQTLHGASISDIALDLGISGETVKTYRKRAYQRPGIGTKHGLLNICLGLSARCGLDTAGQVLLH